MFNPYSHFCLDIETANGEPTDIERWARLEWSPDPRWKPETIGARYLDAIAKKKEKLALLDTAPIICVSIKTEMDLRCLHCMRAQPATAMGAGVVEGHAGERDMLLALRFVLETRCNDETLLIGHNIRRFDLPRLRSAFIRNGLRLPPHLATPDQPVFDSMVEYARHFRGSDEGIFISAADLMDNFRITHHKGTVEGSQVPALFAAGNFDEIAAYALLDAAKEYEIFLRMTGQCLADDPPTINGTAAASPSTSIAPILHMSIVQVLEAKIAAADSMAAVAKVFTEIFVARKELGEAAYADLTKLCEQREAVFTPTGATAGVNF